MKRTLKGFTLVELAIVLVIVGMLIGGVLAGQEIVNQSKLRTAISDTTGYLGAFNVFQLKYSALAGDYSRATVMFPTCDETYGFCNGNGNGVFGGTEGLIMWRHMGLAGILKQSYNTGDYGDYEEGSVARISLPESATYILRGEKGDFHSEQGFDYAPKNKIMFYTHNATDGLHNGFVQSDYVQAMDEKIDDGHGGTGSMRVFTRYGNDCADPTSGEYIPGIFGECEFVIGLK